MTAGRTTATVGRMGWPALAVRVTSAVATPVTLYAVAVVVGIWASGFVAFPTNEGSAYYVAVAGNLADGRGLVIDTLWSYSTPPLVLPRPAFELWQPMASFLAALPMALLNGSFGAAQLGGVLLGAAVAPLAWALTRDAGRALAVPAERLEMLAVCSGMLAVVAAPFLLAVAVPESTLPFLVFGGLACWLAPRALSGRATAGVALGVALGLAYLSRHEAVYIGAVVLAAAVVRGRAWQSMGRKLAAVAVGGIMVVGPWLVRNLAVFGTPLPGQALDNAFLTNNEQIFDYATRPSLAAFLDQGAARIVGNVAAAVGHNLVDVIVVMAMPIGLVGLVAAIFLARRRGVDRPAWRSSGLWLLLVSGGLTFAVASLVFPVASLWGTFQHASGPLLLGLTIAAVLGADAVVDSVRRRRGWQRANAWLAPLALVLVAAPLSLLQLALLAGAAQTTATRYDALADVVSAQPEAMDGATVIISDHPIWLSAATGLSTLALPAEPTDVVLRLAHDQHASLIVVAEGRGSYPAAFRTGALAGCFVERAVSAAAPAGSAVFAVDPSCVR